MYYAMPTAYILINSILGKEEEIIKQISQIKQVKEVRGTYGVHRYFRQNSNGIGRRNE